MASVAGFAVGLGRTTGSLLVDDFISRLRLGDGLASLDESEDADDPELDELPDELLDYSFIFALLTSDCFTGDHFSSSCSRNI